ncbi:hypothetical protein GCM10017778_21940 [Streptomyces vinaceus]|nr:hypothetical protein GCM10017778_21940 [Streptomyces vinaceus]
MFVLVAERERAGERDGRFARYYTGADLDPDEPYGYAYGGRSSTGRWTRCGPRRRASCPAGRTPGWYWPGRATSLGSLGLRDRSDELGSLRAVFRDGRRCVPGRRGPRR